MEGNIKNVNLEEMEWVNYGYANGWTSRPERLKLAKNDPEAEIKATTVGNCQTKYTCEKYKFYYLVDSSD